MMDHVSKEAESMKKYKTETQRIKSPIESMGSSSEKYEDRVLELQERTNVDDQLLRDSLNTKSTCEMGSTAPIHQRKLILRLIRIREISGNNTNSNKN